MTSPPNDDHDCGWKAYAKHQDAKLSELQRQLAAMKAKVEQLALLAKGHKSERRKTSKKMPPPVKAKPEPQETLDKRKALAELRNTEVKTETSVIPVPTNQCTCPNCGNSNLRQVGSGKPSTVIDYVPGYFRRHVNLRETLSCRCGYIVTAPAPDRVAEKTRYAAGFVAHLAVSKCSSSMPQYRLEKEYKSLGIPISRSTMCSLFHRGAKELRPIYNAACRLVALAPDVHADETSFRQLDRKQKSFMWNFVTTELIVYCYAENRSGETPMRILGDSKGRLVVDAHTGYNAVTKPGGRIRAGCNAHARRKIFENAEHHEAQEALDLIGAIYQVEHEAKKAKIVGTDAHLALRKEKSRPLFARLLVWARKHRHAFEPKSGIARAIRYLLKNRRALGCFLRYATIPPDNNKAEAGLRRVALGRVAFLFVANRESGEDLAVLYTLVASCEMNGVNPIAYLTDVLIRVQTHPANRIEELLPHRWKPPGAEKSA